MRSSKKQNKKQKQKRNNMFSTSRELSDSRAYAGQQVWKMKLPGQVVKLTTTVTTGVISQAITITASDALGFATRFGSTFDECRLIGADIQIRPISAASGVCAFWFDEKSASAPTVNEATERIALRIPASNANGKSVSTMRWRARDLLDLQFSAIGSAANPVFFKIYTDNANWGSPITATDLFTVEPMLFVEFRGLKST